MIFKITKKNSCTQHQEYLDQHCRICGRRLGISKYSTRTHSHTAKLFGIDVTTDDRLIHPSFFCNSCHLTGRRLEKQHQQESSKFNLLEWLPHNDDHCNVCDTKCKGGRPKKKNAAGRPSALKKHIQSVASRIPGNDISNITQPGSYTEDFTCVFCKSFVVKPVEIQPCKSLACSICCINVSPGETFHCPGCSNIHECTASVFSKLSPIVEKVLCQVLVKCKTCGHPVTLSAAYEKCSHHEQAEQVALEEVVQVPLDAELTNLEKRAAVNLVSRMIHHQGDSTLTLPRRGRVSNTKNNN